ncbi:carboxymuconolactone decarboxylase family protein [Chitinophaga sp. CF418]|uniref:carboxymuconolactone decarboxylase family protein n=1 Tax=Chitinophaga sp. CF418 TaxID=1855287 RepID=UPI0009237114|nr:carboxymuconolactone decarboxylase family protein [Chitinophaga sp. CF418]SHN23880.1 alkylhydroperoxidase AhpD family core domain-containing protein [Chitinophaga sp. CF418]
MLSFEVPTRETVSDNNKVIFDKFINQFGFMPNLIAMFAYSETALADYLAIQSRKGTLTIKEKEVVYLVVSEINDCKYCVPGHALYAKNLGFSEEQIIQIRKGDIPFDDRLNALAHFVKDITLNKGRPREASVEAFFKAGYNEANLVDVIIAIGDKVITNYLHNITQVSIEWPAVRAISQ